MTTLAKEDERLHHEISPRSKVKTSYSHVRPPYPARERQEPPDYSGPRPSPSSKSKSKLIPYQHVAGTGRPTRRGRSSSPAHRQSQFKPGRYRHRSFTDASSLLTSSQNEDSLATPLSPGHKDYEPRLEVDNRRGQKMGWKDLASMPNTLHQSYRSSKEDREGVSRRHSRDERERSSGFSLDHLPRMDRDKGRERDRGRRSSVELHRNRDKGREGDGDKDKVRETTLEIAAQHRHLGVIELLQKGTEIEPNEKEAEAETNEKEAEVKPKKGIEVEMNAKGAEVETSDKGTEIETNEKGEEVDINEVKAEIEMSWKCLSFTRSFLSHSDLYCSSDAIADLKQYSLAAIAL
jgi:hypothetical protein